MKTSGLFDAWHVKLATLSFGLSLFLWSEFLAKVEPIWTKDSEWDDLRAGSGGRRRVFIKAVNEEDQHAGHFGSIALSVKQSKSVYGVLSLG